MNIVDHALASEQLLKKIRQLREDRELAQRGRFGMRIGPGGVPIVTFLDLGYNQMRDLVTCSSNEAAAKVVDTLALAAIESIDADLAKLLEQFNRPLIEAMVTGDAA